MGGDSFSWDPSVALDQLAWEVALALVLCWSEGGNLFQDDHASTAATEHQQMDQPTTKLGYQHLEQPTTKLVYQQLRQPAATVVVVHQPATKAAATVVGGTSAGDKGCCHGTSSPNRTPSDILICASVMSFKFKSSVSDSVSDTGFSFTATARSRSVFT